MLTSEEMLSGVLIGSRRRIVSMQKNLNTGTSERSWDKEIEGALAEVALAKHLGVYMDPSLGKYKAQDVGAFHVRHTELDNGFLIIRDQDPEGTYVLLTGKAGRYSIKGCIDSKDARQMNDCRKAPNNREESWFIPQDRLDKVWL